MTPFPQFGAIWLQFLRTSSQLRFSPARWRVQLLAVCGAMLLIWSQGVAAYEVSPGIARFKGVYTGSAEVERPDGTMETRNMHVEIRPSQKGFWVKWSTQRLSATGKVKTKSYEILFEPSGRGEVFSAAMQQNVFGHAVPLNPLKGEPYVWGRILGDTLSVFSLFIGENGDYEMQQYDRTLVEGGLQLEFSSHRNGFPRLQANSFLTRQP